MPPPSDRGDSSNLRGRLSEVYLPALLAVELEQLSRRLGDRAVVDDPLFGRSAGPASLADVLKRSSNWLSEHHATFKIAALLAGSDRDVTEGTLTLDIDGRRISLPVALVAEKRREREIEVRVYYSLTAVLRPGQPRDTVLQSDDDVAVPPPVAALLDALADGNLDSVISSFEDDATLCAGDGTIYSKGTTGRTLRDYFSNLVSQEGGGAKLSKKARADDGRACALEYVVTQLRGRDAGPLAGLAVYERGDSGLLRAVRVYDDIG